MKKAGATETTGKTVTERLDAIQKALDGELKLPSKRVRELKRQTNELGAFVDRISQSFGPGSSVTKSLSELGELKDLEENVEAARKAAASKPRRTTGVLSRQSRASAAQPEVKGNTASIQPTKTIDEQVDDIMKGIDRDVDIDEQVDNIMSQIDRDVDLELAEAAEPGQKQPAAATTPDLSEQEAMAILDAALEEMDAAPAAPKAQEPAPKEPTVHSIEELEELKITDEEPSGPEPTEQQVEDAMAVLKAASGENDAAPVVQQEQEPARTAAPAETKGVKLGTQRSGSLHTKSEIKLDRLDETRMIAMMNAMREIADQQGGVIEMQHGSIRGAVGGSYTLKIGEVTIAINRTANEASVNHLSDVTVSFKSPQNAQAKEQAQALAREVTSKIATSISQVSENVIKQAEAHINQAQLQYKEAKEAESFNVVNAAAASTGRISNVDELRAAVKIITASEAYQDCHKQEFANDLKSIGKSFKPKAENAPKHEHSSNEMEAFKAVEKLDKLLDLAKKAKNIPIVSNIAQSQLRQHLNKMNGTHLQDGLQELQTKKVENAEVTRVSMSKK